MSIDIRRAGPGEADAVAALVAEAFTPLAVAQWLVTDVDERRRALEGQFRILVGHAVAYGHVDTVPDPQTGDPRAVGVWFPRDVEVPEPDDYDGRLVEACGVHVERFRTLDETMEKHHPEAPHHHLAFLAVSPAHQRQGLGTALLHSRHAALDAHGTAAYLEASSPENRALYLRHGYTHAEPFHLPDGPPMWPMWREPRASG